jgi:hypothetical protein
VFHTAGEPPNSGKVNLANNGWIENKSAALANNDAAKTSATQGKRAAATEPELIAGD